MRRAAEHLSCSPATTSSESAAEGTWAGALSAVRGVGGVEPIHEAQGAPPLAGDPLVHRSLVVARQEAAVPGHGGPAAARGDAGVDQQGLASNAEWSFR